MPTTRRQFIKQGLGMVSVGVMLPKVIFSEPGAQDIRLTANLGRKLVLVQFNGGNDGLNTVIPYTDPLYLSRRETIGFRESELVDDTGAPMIIEDGFALHPRLKQLRDLYSARKVAIIRGVGYPNQSTSHFEGTANIAAGRTDGTVASGGWLGRYAAQAFTGQNEFMAAAIGGLPQAFFSSGYVIPAISNFAQYTFNTDNRFNRDRNNQLAAFTAGNARTFEANSFIGAIAATGAKAYSDAVKIQTETAKYSPQGYPNTNLGNALRMVSQLMVTIPSTSLAHVSIGGFDTHNNQVTTAQGVVSKLNGGHASLLLQFSEAIQAFYNDMVAHGLGQDLIILTYSEFGRRPAQNGTFGTDHGRSAPWFVIGDNVRGGLYSDQPSLESTALDRGGNQRETCDFRQVYAEVIDRWFNHDSRSVLGDTYSHLGFL
jgi:uncharacterized protein (DUF1501 family)